jgi:hypothetical protein
MSRHRAAHGLTGAPSRYALIDNARRARLGQTRQEYAAAMGALFAPFTRVAAASPHAAAPVERSATELVTPTEANRPIADPYTRYIVAREGELRRRPAADVGGRGSTCPPAWPPCWRSSMLSKWRVSERATWPRSTCTAAFPHRCSISATALALIPGIRVASLSPPGCRSSATRATTTPCTPSPKPSSGPGATPAGTGWSAPTAAS